MSTIETLRKQESKQLMSDARRLETVAKHLRQQANFSLTKKQSTRLIKCVCPECGYTARITHIWLDTGNVTCPCGHELKAQQ